LTAFLSQVLLTNPDQLKFLMSNDSYVDLQAISTKTEAELKELFQVTIRPNANRAHEIRIKLEMALRFNEFKKPLFFWLQENDFWLDLHGFGVQVLRTMKIGFIFHLEPHHIFCKDF
jgi:hypothetical protein